MPRHTSRRDLLCQVAGSTLLLRSSIATLGAASPAFAAESDSDEVYWQTVREQFSFDDAKVPMNAANLCPTPRAVSQRAVQWTNDIDRDCSFNNRAKFAALLETSRQKVARQLGVSADEIALVRNTSEANNVINNGVTLKAGDEVLLWDQNHPTNNVAWEVRAARFGFRVTRVATPANPTTTDQLVDTFTNAFTGRTRVLAVTHASNVSGLRLPVKDLCEEAHARGIYVHVDGAQSWGALNLNLRELGCDSFAASAHKWFVGPKEVGLLFVKRDRIEEIWPNVVAPGWGQDVAPDVRGARKFESLGQRDDAALAAIGDVVEFHEAIGPDRVERRVTQLASTLKSAVANAGIVVRTPLEPDLSAGVCIIAAPDQIKAKAANRMYTEFGIAGAPTGGLRLCPHIYNTLAHVERAVRGVKKILG